MSQPTFPLEPGPPHTAPPGRALLRGAALVLFLGVALGAFGAHGLEERLKALDRVDTWETAVLYHFIHGLAMLGLALALPRARGPYWAFLAGIVIFSGSLYILSLTGLKWLGAITPIGGVAFLVGWAWLAFRR